MDATLLQTMGQIAGIGGLALGVFLVLFRDLIGKRIFPQLTQVQAFRLLRLIAVLVWSVAVLGLGIWVLTGPGDAVIAGDRIDADCSAVVTGTVGASDLHVGCGEDHGAP